MLLLLAGSLIIIAVLTIYSLSLKRKNLEQENTLRKLDYVLENKMLMRESSLNESIQIKKSLLKKIGRTIKEPSMNLVNKITLLLDKFQEPSLNLLDVKNTLDDTYDDAIMLYRYVRNILDVTNYEDGKLIFNIKKYDLKHFLETLINAQEIRCKRRNKILLRYNADNILEFDPFRIEQLFDNLLNYVMQNSNDKVIVIDVCRNISSNEVIISIIQNTIFLQARQISSIFSSSEENFDGESICKIIVNHHGGKIWSSISENNELCFSLSLPSSSPMKDTHTKPVTSYLVNNNISNILQSEKLDLKSLINEYHDTYKDTKKSHILFIDDNLAMQECANIIFPHMGYSVEIAKSGQDAINLIKKSHQRYDLIILDIFMEDISGIDVLKNVYKIIDHNQIPIILQSGDNDPKYKTDYNGYGVVDFISKPYSMSKIASVLSNALLHKRLNNLGHASEQEFIS